MTQPVWLIIFSSHYFKVIFFPYSSTVSSSNNTCEICKTSLCDRFYDWPTYNGHKYYLFMYYHVDADQAEQVCEHCDMYLVEINDRAELQYVQENARARFIDGLLIGGTDRFSENQWFYQGSKEFVTFYDWSSGNPDNYMDKEDFMSLHRDYNYRMNDVPNKQLGSYKFLCEKNP